MEQDLEPAGYRLRAAERAEESDGRRHRSQTSQRRIVNAMLELIEEGHYEPSADQIALRAGVGRRSVFRHFEDMDTLYREMTDSVVLAVGAAVLEPFKAVDWRGRLLEAVDRRAVVFERMRPFLRAVQVHRHRAPFLEQARTDFVALLRRLVVDLLAGALDDDPGLIETFEMLLSVEAWNRLRDDQGLDDASARQVLKRAISAILDARGSNLGTC